jgi:hypothetical protein
MVLLLILMPLTFIFFVAFIVSLLACTVRKTRHWAKWAAPAMFIVMIVVFFMAGFENQKEALEDSEASKLGFADAVEQRAAKAAGVNDVITWHAKLDNDARQRGFNNAAEQRAAKQAGVFYAAQWHARQARKQAQEQEVQKQAQEVQRRTQELSETVSTRIEPGAYIDSDLNGSTINAVVAMVRSNDFRCDSISNARSMFTARGIQLVCNHFDYTYDIEDKGGHWVVKVE